MKQLQKIRWLLQQLSSQLTNNLFLLISIRFFFFFYSAFIKHIFDCSSNNIERYKDFELWVFAVCAGLFWLVWLRNYARTLSKDKKVFHNMILRMRTVQPLALSHLNTWFLMIFDFASTDMFKLLLIFHATEKVCWLLLWEIQRKHCTKEREKDYS